MENKHQHSATTAPHHHHNHLHNPNNRGQETQGAVVADSNNRNINNSNSNPVGQLESITISASYWDENKYSAFDLVRQQSQGEQGLGWSQDIVKK